MGGGDDLCPCGGGGKLVPLAGDNPDSVAKPSSARRRQWKISSCEAMILLGQHSLDEVLATPGPRYLASTDMIIERHQCQAVTDAVCTMRDF